MPAVYQPVYKALISMRVKFPDGTYHDLNPGEPIPGAEKWANPYLWVKRKHIARIDGTTVDPGVRGVYEPPRNATLADFERGQDLGTLRGSPFPSADQAGLGSGEGQPSAAVDFTDAELDKAPVAIPAVDKKALAELQAHTRKELFVLAEKLGVRVNKNDSKEALAKALLLK